MTEEQFTELMKWLTRIERRLADIEELVTPPVETSRWVVVGDDGSFSTYPQISYDEWCQRNVPGCEGKA
jgi:hypothetical protein